MNWYLFAHPSCNALKCDWQSIKEREKSTYVAFEFLKLSSRVGGGDRGDGCSDAVTICGLGDDIDEIGIKSDDTFSMCSRSPIIGSLQSTILMNFFEWCRYSKLASLVVLLGSNLCVWFVEMVEIEQELRTLLKDLILYLWYLEAEKIEKLQFWWVLVCEQIEHQTMYTYKNNFVLAGVNYIMNPFFTEILVSVL